MFVTARSAATNAEYELWLLGGAQLWKFSVYLWGMCCASLVCERAPARILKIVGMRSSPCFAR